MILSEMHLHTKEVSPCGNVSAREIPALYKRCGYGNIVVTDHFTDKYLKKLSRNRTVALNLWLEGYQVVAEMGQKIGLNVFLGIEITLNESENEYLIYGITENFVKNCGDIFDSNIAQFYKLIKYGGYQMYQAHPFRGKCQLQNPEYIDGIEVFNGNKRHESHNDYAFKAAKAHQLKMLAGSDFHEYEDLGCGGIYLPQVVKTNDDLVKYLSENDPELWRSTNT